jgi:hypothetical protein
MIILIFLAPMPKKKHIKRCARRQNMYIIASLKHALPLPPQGSIGAKKNLNNHPV